MNWHARMIYPYEAGTGSNGHYDLQFDGTYELDTITYTDPVFSYADEGGTGYLYVFDKSLTVAIYEGFLPFSGYHYNETSYSVSTTAFTDLINASVNRESRTRIAVRNSSGVIIGYKTRYSLTTSYQNYDEANRNCFKAVGLWVSALGDNRFTDFANRHPHTDYTAYNMVNTPIYAVLWDYQGSYTSY